MGSGECSSSAVSTDAGADLLSHSLSALEGPGSEQARPLPGSEETDRELKEDLLKARSSNRKYKEMLVGLLIE